MATWAGHCGCGSGSGGRSGDGTAACTCYSGGDGSSGRGGDGGDWLLVAVVVSVDGYTSGPVRSPVSTGKVYSCRRKAPIARLWPPHAHCTHTHI